MTILLRLTLAYAPVDASEVAHGVPVVGRLVGAEAAAVPHRIRVGNFRKRPQLCNLSETRSALKVWIRTFGREERAVTANASQKWSSFL